MKTHFDIIWHLYEWGFEKGLKGEVLVGWGGKNIDKLKQENETLQKDKYYFSQLSMNIFLRPFSAAAYIYGNISNV